MREGADSVEADGLAAAQLANHGVSETLIGLLQGLADQTRAEGRPRFTLGAVSALRRAILCRNHASLTLELGHLMQFLARAAPDDEQIALRLFWVEEMTTPAEFCARIESGQLPLPENTALKRKRLRLGPLQDDFELNLHRLPLWLALLELLVFIDPAVAGPLNAQVSAREYARGYQKMLRGFLSEHLQPEHIQQRSYAVLRRLNIREARQIDDENILECWLQAEPDEDFRRFRSVAETCIYLRRALEFGGRRLASEQAVEIGEMDGWLALDETFAETLDEPPPYAERLTRHPKFLSASAWNICELPVRFMPEVEPLPLTLLRMRVFGDVQARMIEAVKRKRDFAAIEPASNGYREWLDELEGSIEKMRTAAAAAAHALVLQGEIEQAIGAAAEWLPGEFTGDSERLVAELKEQPDLRALRLRHPGLNRALASCEEAFAGINRAGFKGQSDLAAPDDYLAGLQTMSLACAVIRRFHTVAGGANFATDLAMFMPRLTELHGSIQ